MLEESWKMKHFDHMHVMTLLGVCLDAGPAPYIIMPYMAHGSLLSYLKRERNSLFLPQDAADEQVCNFLCNMDCYDIFTYNKDTVYI